MIVKFSVHSLSDLIDHDFFDERMRESLGLLSESEQDEVFEEMESYFDKAPSMEEACAGMEYTEDAPSMDEIKEYLSGELKRRLPFGF